MSDQPAFKYKYATIPISGDNDLVKTIHASRAFDEVMAREMDRLWDDLQWATVDDQHHRHIGPVHHPNRRDLYEARQRIRQDDYFRSLGRPRGPYLRTKP